MNGVKNMMCVGGDGDKIRKSELYSPRESGCTLSFYNNLSGNVKRCNDLRYMRRQFPYVKEYSMFCPNSIRSYLQRKDSAIDFITEEEFVRLFELSKRRE